MNKKFRIWDEDNEVYEYAVAWRSFWRQVDAIDEAFVKSDEEELARFFRDPKDKIAVQEKIDHMIRNQVKESIIIIIKGRELTIKI